ncbi:MAG: hypothetical protein U0002_05495 [Thermoanaerobaculia bacterium]
MRKQLPLGLALVLVAVLSFLSLGSLAADPAPTPTQPDLSALQLDPAAIPMSTPAAVTASCEALNGVACTPPQPSQNCTFANGAAGICRCCSRCGDFWQCFRL